MRTEVVCTELGVCGLGGATYSSRMHASVVVVGLHVLYDAYRCRVWRSILISFRSCVVHPMYCRL